MGLKKQHVHDGHGESHMVKVTSSTISPHHNRKETAYLSLETETDLKSVGGWAFNVLLVVGGACAASMYCLLPSDRQHVQCVTVLGLVECDTKRIPKGGTLYRPAETPIHPYVIRLLIPPPTTTTPRTRVQLSQRNQFRCCDRMEPPTRIEFVTQPWRQS
jgi:hypothetical protein